MSREVLQRPRLSALQLPSGRRLGLAEQGDPQGVPVLFFHGFAGSCLQCPPEGDLPARVGVRLIAVDRPGIGRSDRVPRRRLLDWAQDVEALADQFGFRRFAVLGWSAGGPHALVCGYALSERVVSIGLASPMGGWFVGPGASRHISKEARGLTTFVRFAPWAIRPSLGLLARRISKHPKQVVADQVRHLPSTDQETLASPTLQQMLVETLGEGFRQGTGGVFDDILAVARPWGFFPRAVESPVWLWQGEADTMVLPALAQELADQLPHCQVQMVPQEGHFLLFTHWQEILQTLARSFSATAALPHTAPVQEQG